MTGEEQVKFWDHRLKVEGRIYLIQGEPGTPVKIGFSDTPKSRRRTLQTASPYPLRILCVIPGNRRLEKVMHERFRGARIKGEWFGGEDLDYIIETVTDLAERAIAAYDGSGVPPRINWGFEIEGAPEHLVRQVKRDQEQDAAAHRQRAAMDALRARHRKAA